MMTGWQPEGKLYRDNRERISQLYLHESGGRAEVRIPADTLKRDFDDIPDTLDAKKERTEWVLNAMLEQFFAKSGIEIKPDGRFKICENDVDLHVIAKQFKEMAEGER